MRTSPTRSLSTPRALVCSAFATLAVTTVACSAPVDAPADAEETIASSAAALDQSSIYIQDISDALWKSLDKNVVKSIPNLLHWTPWAATSSTFAPARRNRQ